MAPIPGVADGVDPAAGADGPGGRAGWRELWLRLSRREGAGDGGRTAVSGRAMTRLPGPPEILGASISGLSASMATGAVTAGNSPQAAAMAAVWARMRVLPWA
jgi:hypothetical protein